MILAGFRRSLPPLILLNALAGRTDVEVTAVVCVSEHSLRRIRAWRNRFGSQFLSKVASVLRPVGHSAFDHEREMLAARVRQQQETPSQLPARSQELGVPFELVSGINAPDCLSRIDHYRPDFLIYAGGGILRRGLIERVPRGVLNIHSGPLPHVRGMSAPEWTLYLGLDPTATVHFIDPGIDTGAIVGDVSVGVSRADSLGHVRGRTLLAGIDLLVSLLGPVAAGRTERRENPPGRGRQYHEMVPTLKRVVQSWVGRGLTPVTSHREVDPDDLRPATLRRTSHVSTR